MEITEEMKVLEKSHQIEDQWKLYLKVSGMDRKDIPPHLMDHLKKAFYAGFTHLIMYVKYELPVHNEDVGVDILESIFNQCNIYWQMLEGKNQIN